MGKRKGGRSGSGESHYSITQANLDRKGKTNKKVKRNPNASKYLSVTGQKLREEAAAFAKEHFGKGRRSAAKKRKAEEAAKKAEELALKKANRKDSNNGRKDTRRASIN